MEEGGGEGVEDEGTGGGVEEGGRVRLLLKLQLLLAELQIPVQLLPPPLPTLLLLPSSTSASLDSPSIHSSISFAWRSWWWWCLQGEGGWGGGEGEGGEAGVVGEEGAAAEEGGGLETELWLLMSRKLARGGRSLTPERVEPSMAFWSWRRKRREEKEMKLEQRKGGEVFVVT